MALAGVVLSPASAEEAPKPHKVWAAGPYTFSDELGGFKITGVSGAGTKDDPVVITEELFSATPVTLVIRAIKPIGAFDNTGEFVNGFLHMRIDTLNNSGNAWVEFEFELQENLGRASLFGDGLSFDQRRNETRTHISADHYLEFSRDFEPYDRLRFSSGKVDPLETARFGFLVTDYTPKMTFYLVQDPRIPTM